MKGMKFMLDNRKNMIEWCVLRSGYSALHFEKMSDKELNGEYLRLMDVASNEMLEIDYKSNQQR